VDCEDDEGTGFGSRSAPLEHSEGFVTMNAFMVTSRLTVAGFRT